MSEQTDSGPYIVELDADNACSQCTSGIMYLVVFQPDDVAIGVSYDGSEDAEDIAAMLNSAYQRGFEDGTAKKG